ncbi:MULTISPECIES: response regulator transcription factor [Sphingobacterium]|uniref:LuxR C-terminal-related transcriptional regulator n=1 Tax=Sphingobacterium populi TaxID=1812824 RepID=A0ABW5U9I4_9SPHI|nr:response regulator transcription factor [Sphingobacterium sp. CFCC 11742]
MNILFADSQGVVRFGTINLAKSIVPEIHAFEANSHHYVCHILRTEDIDMLILNTDMCGDHSIAAISKFKSIKPTVRILLISTYTERVFASRLIEAGADDFINIRSSLDHFKTVILRFTQGVSHSSAPVGKSNSKSVNYPDQATGKWLIEKFSERERSVLAFLRNGVPLIEIARLLAIKPSTVSTYKNRIYNKLGVVNQRELTDLMSMAC